jgi:hypothetical protein
MKCILGWICNFLAVVAITAGANAIPVGACVGTYGGTENDDNCYRNNDSPNTWANHEAIAQGLHTDFHLTSILSLTENTFVKNLIGDSFSFFIGYNDITTEGNFVWSDGSSSTYTNWDIGEPTGSSNEDVVRMVSGTSPVWADVDANVTLAGLYKAPIDAVPEPTTLAIFGLGLLSLGAVRRRKKLAA